MEFDYFYGPEDAEQYQFYRIPKLLITSEQFKDVSVESKLLYGKQSVKELIGQNQGVSRMPIGDASIREFEREARKYGVDFAVTRDKTVNPPQYLRMPGAAGKITAQGNL